MAEVSLPCTQGFIDCWYLHITRKHPHHLQILHIKCSFYFFQLSNNIMLQKQKLNQYQFNKYSQPQLIYLEKSFDQLIQGRIVMEKDSECAKISVDNNVITLFYVKRNDLNGKAKFTIMLDKDAWAKGGSLTAPPLTGYDIYFDKGEEGDYGNKHLKQKSINVNPGKMQLALYKAKTFGVKTSYGSVELLAKSDQDLVMYWPNDSSGDQYNNFKNILGEVKGITGDVTSIVTDLAKLGAIAA